MGAAVTSSWPAVEFRNIYFDTFCFLSPLRSFVVRGYARRVNSGKCVGSGKTPADFRLELLEAEIQTADGRVELGVGWW